MSEANPKASEDAKSAEAASPAIDALPSMGKELDLYIRHIDGLASTLPATMMLLQGVSKVSQQHLFAFEDKNCQVKAGEKTREVEVPIEHVDRWTVLHDRHQRYLVARELFPRSILVALLSQFDAFLGRLLRAIFILKPQTLNASEKSLTYAQITSFSSLEDVRDHLIEKEVESILRASHSDQFKWMEARFGLPLTKNLDSWPQFIELTERRNLYVHADGRVSRQYLAVCKEHGFATDVAEGDNLTVTKEYFDRAFVTLFEIGVKLGHVLWRKLFPDDREAADRNFVAISYSLIKSKRYRRASQLLDFARSTFKRYANEWFELALIVNTAQSYRWADKKDKAKEIMSTVDWTAKSDEFKLANAVLSEDWKSAAQIMVRLGVQDAVSKTDYRDWPLFQEFRSQPEFLAAYESVFGAKFVAAKDQKAMDEDELAELGIKAFAKKPETPLPPKIH